MLKSYVVMFAVKKTIRNKKLETFQTIVVTSDNLDEAQSQAVHLFYSNRYNRSYNKWNTRTYSITELPSIVIHDDLKEERARYERIHKSLQS